MWLVETLFVLLIIIWWVAFRWLPAWRWLSVTTALVGIVAIVSGWLPNQLLATLRVAEVSPLPPCAQVVSIVVLGGGTRFDDDLGQYVPLRDSETKELTARSLYERCRNVSTSCTVFLSGGDPQHHGIAEAQAFRRDLLALGIPDRDMRVEGKSLNTYQNAKFIAPMLGVPGSSQIYLVTAPYHMRRSLAMFARFGVEPIAVASAFAPPRQHDAWRVIRPVLDNVRYTFIGVHEWLGLLQLKVYSALGWY